MPVNVRGRHHRQHCGVVSAKFRSRSTSIPMLLFATLMAALLVGALAAPAGGTFAAEAPPQSSEGVWIGPGTTYRSIVARNGTLRGGMVVIDPTADSIQLVASVPAGELGDRQRLTEQATLHGRAAVAGINGDFFYLTSDAPGAPIGLLIRHGELLSSGSGPAFGIDQSGRPIYGHSQWNGRVEVINEEGDVIASRGLCAVNKPRAGNCLVLYSPPWGAHTRTGEGGSEALLVPNPGYQLPLRPEMVLETTVRSQRSGTSNGEIPNGTLALSGHGEGAAFIDQHLQPGMTVRLALHVGEAWQHAVHAIGGAPVLVENGRLADLPNDSGAVRREPRTAVGVDARGRLIWLVVDGRQPGWSDGATFAEMGTMMIEAGAVWALNLDGGGSTTMVIRPPGETASQLANRPSGGERAIGPAWLLLSRAQPGPAAHTWLTVRTESAVQGEASQLVLPQTPLTFRLFAQDAQYEPVVPTEAQLEVVAPTGDGTAAPIVSAEKSGATLRVTAGGPGVVAVRGAVSGQQALAERRIAGPADIAQLEIAPALDTLTPGASVQLRAIAYDADGKQLTGVPASFIWSGTGGFADIQPDGRLAVPDGFASGEIQVALRIVDENGEELAAPLQSVSVAVGEPPAFTDMDGHWALTAVAALTRGGVIKGYPDGSFGPERQVTRAEFAVMLQRLLSPTVAHATRAATGEEDDADTGSDAEPETTGGDGAAVSTVFADAPDIPDWAIDAVLAAVQQGLIQGYPDGTFGPQRRISRQEAAVMLSRLPTLPAPQAVDPFSDETEIGTWALPAVQLMAGIGWVQGYPDGSFKPLAQITRAEAATILYRLQTQTPAETQAQPQN